jgi:hypothetical protein
MGLEELAAAGMLDRAFAPLARDYAGRIGWLAREEPELLRTALAAGVPGGAMLLENGKTETTPRAAARGA